MRGPKPKPTSDRMRRPDAPQMAPLTTETPVELAGDAVALAEWTRLHALLTDSGVMTEGDRTAVIAVCQQWSLYRQAREKLATSGLVVKAQSGYPMPNPYIAIASKALVHCEKLWAELGLTPSARTRVRGRAKEQARPAPTLARRDPRKVLRMVASS